MNPPHYRTLDGDEVELPLAMDHWVLVPRVLARFDPELTWTLDYDDAPEPEHADPRLDFSAGALLVPVERWNEHAALEPNLGPCQRTPTDGTLFEPAPRSVDVTGRASSEPAAGCFPALRPAALASRWAVLVLAALASAYVVAVGAWLWSLRDGISGAEVSSGLLLVGAAALLAWVAGVMGAGGDRRRFRQDLRGPGPI
jgi:hypothetical protein